LPARLQFSPGTNVYFWVPFRSIFAHKIEKNYRPKKMCPTIQK